ncbi:dienelactone hydrolase family protein [Croceicoccus sp. Ery15]|uniref:dienelactone hydrolase family protein n=1 Tax=Croceicoccus sp. Ery15 TaxID=1703338 RepID=UPI001E313CF9|nr:dienelactone hydrolase family protein [Croceicoccus sp. Ery15]
MQTEAIAYSDGDMALTGWLVRPECAPTAAILILPTIANRNEAMDRRAAMLADAGYLVFIADFYGLPDASIEQLFEAGRALMADTPAFRQRIRAACDKAEKIAAGLPLFSMGFCMGGRGVLELARTGAPIRSAISFHGLLATDMPANGRIDAKILVCHGDADPMVPRGDVAAFQTEMDAAGADWQLMVFGGAKHGFTDPASDLRDNDAVAYHEQADRQSWSAAMLLIEHSLAAA